MRTHRRRILLTLGALLLVVRIALPYVLRRVIESQANAAIAGQVTVGDVDLYLMRGGLALDDVALRMEDAAPEHPPVVAFERFYVNIGYLALLFRTVRIQDVQLDGLAIDVDRREDGAFVLPSTRPAPPDAAPPPAEEPAGEPWGIVVDRAALRAGTLVVDDHITEPATRVELDLPALDLTAFSLQYGPDARPGHGVVEARFRDGRARVKTSVATKKEGFAVGARLDIDNLPLDQTHLHVPQLRWKTLRGRLDAGLTFAARPQAMPVVDGTITFRDVQVEVPEETAPALAWKRLDVEIERLDRASRIAYVKRVALVHAGVIVHPREPVPLPILPRGDGGAPPPPADTPDAPAEPDEPWRWRVDAVEVTDSVATVVLEPPPLAIGIVRLGATGLSSERGSTAQVALELREGDGAVVLDGTLGLDPLAARQTLQLRGLEVERLLAATGATPAHVGAKIDAALNIGAERDPVTVAGTIGVHELAVTMPDNKDFAFGWRDLDLAIRELVLPGVMPGAERTGAPVRLALDHLKLNAPNATLTRTADGFVLPAGGGPEEAAAPPAEAPPSTVPPPPPAADSQPAPSPVTAEIAQLELTGGLVDFSDRSVQPAYRGKVSSLELRAKNLRYPENTFDTVNLSLRAPGGAPIKVDGVREKGAVRIQSRIDGLPLAQFNPYVKSAAGYSISRGAATFGSTVKWGEKKYQSDNRLTLQSFTLAGAEGDSLFAQNFGIPLTLALGLLTDVSGKISLGVPVSGDRERGASIKLGSIVGEALARAIVNAVASPLKLIGAVTMSGDKVGSIAPDPVGFIPGLPEIADDEWWRVEQLANFLPTLPTLTLTLAGMAGPADARALSEAAVLAEMQAGSRALGALRNVASGGKRGAIRAALEKRVRGVPGELEPDEMEELDRMVAEKPVNDDQLRTLAAARAERLRKVLADDYGAGADRVKTGDAVIDREGGKSQVVVTLGS
jgi:hypothetical protein